MGQRSKPFDQSWAKVIYYELLNFIEETQGIPNRYRFYRGVLLMKGYRLSRGSYDYWIDRLKFQGLITIDPATKALCPKDVAITVSIDRSERDDFLAQQAKDGHISIGSNYRSPEIVQPLYRMQKGKCWWCGDDLLGVYHVDHRVPTIDGGSSEIDNLCLACPQCNLKKKDQLPHECMGRLL